MLSKRKLLKWRKEALMFKKNVEETYAKSPTIIQLDRLLELTQVLIDRHLLNEK